MKKSFLHSFLFAFLFILSMCACFYVNVTAFQKVSKGEVVDTEQQENQELSEKTDVSLIEVEFLKKIIKQGASKLPSTDI